MIGGRAPLTNLENIVDASGFEEFETAIERQ